MSEDHYTNMCKHPFSTFLFLFPVLFIYCCLFATHTRNSIYNYIRIYKYIPCHGPWINSIVGDRHPQTSGVPEGLRSKVREPLFSADSPFQEKDQQSPRSAQNDISTGEDRRPEGSKRRSSSFGSGRMHYYKLAMVAFLQYLLCVVKKYFAETNCYQQ